MSRRAFLVTALVAALLLAGVGSYYASTHPDGLERVAEQVGLADAAQDSAASDSPFADYGTAGVEDDRLSGGLAGVAGALVTLLLAGGLVLAVRRRGGTGGTDDTDDTDVTDGADDRADERSGSDGR